MVYIRGLILLGLAVVFWPVTVAILIYAMVAREEQDRELLKSANRRDRWRRGYYRELQEETRGQD